MHDTQQLMECGLADDNVSPLFLGVFPADHIPKFFPHKDWCLIANTDPADKKGQHWVAFGSRWGHLFFFDSYGKKPSNYQLYWSRFDSWNRSKQDVQQLVSDVCGDWCLYWCIAFSRATSENRLSNFMEKFSNQDKELNNRHVFRIIHSRFPRILNSTKHFINLDSLIREKLKIFAHPECLLNRQICRNRHGQ